MKFYRTILLLLFFAFFEVTYCFAQNKTDAPAGDSVIVNTAKHGRNDRKSVTENIHTTDSVLKKKHSPKIAIALSAVLPGAGQVYNHRWWKVPIIYAGIGVSAYFVYDFSKDMILYKTEYRNRMQEHFDLLNPDLNTYSDENVLSLKKYYQRNMEIAAAAIAIIYVLNLIDALVDAHLYYFDISEDLSLHFSPYLQPSAFDSPGSAGLTFALKWK